MEDSKIGFFYMYNSKTNLDALTKRYDEDSGIKKRSEKLLEKAKSLDRK